jgi:hypothetical protein
MLPLTSISSPRFTSGQFFPRAVREEQGTIQGLLRKIGQHVLPSTLKDDYSQDVLDIYPTKAPKVFVDEDACTRYKVQSTPFYPSSSGLYWVG